MRSALPCSGVAPLWGMQVACAIFADVGCALSCGPAACGRALCHDDAQCQIDPKPHSKYARAKGITGKSRRRKASGLIAQLSAGQRGCRPDDRHPFAREQGVAPKITTQRLRESARGAHHYQISRSGGRASGCERAGIQPNARRPPLGQGRVLTARCFGWCSDARRRAERGAASTLNCGPRLRRMRLS